MKRDIFTILSGVILGVIAGWLLYHWGFKDGHNAEEVYRRGMEASTWR